MRLSDLERKPSKRKIPRGIFGWLLVILQRPFLSLGTAKKSSSMLHVCRHQTLGGSKFEFIPKCRQAFINSAQGTIWGLAPSAKQGK